MIGRITAELLAQLEAIEPSVDGSLEYRPCRVRLADGRFLERVYVVDADQFTWLRPEEMPSGVVPIESVVRIQEDPSRLPAALATRLYQAGESGMGYCIFTVKFASGRRAAFVAGNAVDFPNWPAWAGNDPVVDVFPHEGREAFRHRPPRPDESSAPFLWCLYRRP